MTDHKQDNNHIDPSLMDTQRLLLGVDLPEDAPFDLDDILAEYGGFSKPPPPQEEVPEPPPPEPEPEPGPEPEPEPPPPPPEPRPRRSLRRRPKPAEEAPAESPAPPPPPEEEVPPPPPAPDPPPEEPVAEPDEEALDLAFWDDFAASEGLRLTEDEPEEPLAQEPEPPPPEAPAVSMEDVVASTVDAVREDQEKRQEKLRRRLEKAVSRKPKAASKRREPASRRPPPEVESEPPAGETAARHKRRFRECHRALTLAGIVLTVLWLPWLLEQLGMTVPFFSESAGNAALCVLLAQALLCILCWPVYRAAVQGLREGFWTICATALLATLVTLLDEMTMLLLPERTDAAPLGGLAAALSVFALWGLTGWHRGMSDTFRIAAMGEPARVVDCGPQGISRGRGSGAGFYTRAAMEDTSSQWQRLLLPVLAAASLVFAILASIGQDREQDFLWCWSVILCASSSLAFPLSFQVPFGRVAAHLARSGAAVAGMYGAAAFASGRRLTVTDADLFPPGAARLAGVKVYGEEQNQALSYAATLAVQGGGLLARLFGDAVRVKRVSLQSLEHFHIHEDGGLGGMIRGETVLVGSPSFMRRQAVRLPHTLASKTAICLAVDGELTAIFTVKYAAAEPAEYALRILRRNGFRLSLATRDSNLTPKFLKARFGWDGGAEPLEIGERLTLSDSEREAGGPEGLLYRDGILPYAFLAVDGRRLCQTVLVGNLLSIFSSIAGALLGFYLTFTHSYGVLTPVLLLTFMVLWVVPMLPLVATVDKA